MHRFSSDAIFMKGKYMEENTVKKIEVAEVEELLLNHSDDIIVQVAPAVRVALGEMFSLKVGTNVEKKMISALRKLGFKYVFDKSLDGVHYVLDLVYETHFHVDLCKLGLTVGA